MNETTPISSGNAAIPAPEEIRWEEAARPDETADGASLISALARQLPNSPGVYRMFSRDGDVLYVGKAHNLKKRVAAYARTGGHTSRISRMIRETAYMEFVRTHTETEALLLEANLIKRLRPRFNVLLRDDKSFPYIVITADHRAPGVFKHRGARVGKREYFGPFASAGAVGRTINVMQRAFLLRTCTDSMFESRTRPCLLYQIKRCSAPCTGEVSLPAYAGLIDEAMRFLSGKSTQIRLGLTERMEKAAEKLDFETAAIYRDRLSALSQIQSHQGINPRGTEEADVFAVEQKGGVTCIQVFFFRTGQNWGNRAYYPRADKSLEGGEVLGAFLAQFYDDKPCPRQLLLSREIEERELLEQALSLKAGRRVSIVVPRRGEKRELVEHAALNARETLARKLAETATQASLLDGVAEAFGLIERPRRIEVYDNSHIMGSHPVGAMIVAGANGFAKTQYRKFNIKSKEIVPGDDLAMMREVLTRRFARMVKEQAEMTEAPARETGELPAWPDLVIIDGGQAQFNTAREVFDSMGLLDRFTVVGIAKGPDRDAGRERFFIDGRAPFSLPTRDPVLYFVQRLRDEAHRFAIGAHRTRRKNEMARNALDDVPGVGPARKRALLRHFGTAKAVSRAGLTDLRSVEGVSAQTAQAIYDHFHETG
jgi:excinuclease ABC subunit C